MAPRKRTHDEMDSIEPPMEVPLIEKIRNMWEFASTMQFIFLFGKVVKIDEDFDIEDFEEECLKPGHSEKLDEIGLTLLKWISSHRGLNYEIWDEYTRRQYLSKAPQLNPYGDEEQPKRFRDFDIFTKIRILHQLTVWTLWNPDRMRERLPDHQKESDQLEWRIEEIGYDREERNYYLLDDNRLYRRTEPPLPSLTRAKPKANTLKAQAARRRASKRRRVIDSETPDVTAEEDTSSQVDHLEDFNHTNADGGVTANIDTYGGYKWECVAITLTQYHEFSDSLKKSKDPNEKYLRQKILDDIVPIIEAAEEKQRRKMERRERELLTMEKMATAKRSSRLAGKHEREKQERDAAEAEEKRRRDLAEAHRQQETQERMELDRMSRMMTREQRIKDREFKRLLKEEELAKAAEDAKKIESGEARGSERHLRDKMERAKKDLEELQAEDEWSFDCSGCGVHGKNIDDGSHSVACEKCNVWQHSKCLGISKAAAEDEDFHFVCKDCQRRAEEANKPKIMLKVRNPMSVSPPGQKATKHMSQSPSPQNYSSIEVPKKRPVGRPPKMPASNGNTTPGKGSSSSSQQGATPSGWYNSLQQPNSAHYTTQYHTATNGYSRESGPASAVYIPQAMSQQPNGFTQARPGSASGPSYLPQPYTSLPPNASPYQQAGGYQQYPPYHNSFAHQYHGFSPAQPRDTPLGAWPSPHQPNTNGSTSSNTPRIPSPVINRPTFSPTQGNHDTSAVAGIPQKSPILSHPSLFTPSPQRQSTSQNAHVSPSGTNAQHYTAQSPNLTNPSHLSGISPTKHSPIPPPSKIPQKLSMSPPPPQSTPTARSVSGTLQFPPTENLAPSPEQLSKQPVPTPAKQMSPVQLGHEELRRVSEEVKEHMAPLLPSR